MSPRAAITATFFLNGAIFSAWYARLPAIQADLGLSEGEIGLALLGAPAGLFAAQPVVGALASRRGSRVLVRLAPLYMLAVALPALAVDLPTLLLAVAVVGAANGALDIAMNAQGLVVERRATGPIFASLHAAFSFGALAGAAAAGAFAAAGVEPLPHLLLWAGAGAGAGAVAAALLSPGYVDDAASGARDARRLARPSSRLAVLGTIAFVALLAEGAVFDWSGIYLARETGAADGVAALGLAAFSMTMGLGRLTADPLTARLGAAQVARAGAALAASAWPRGWLPAPPLPGSSPSR
jgi:predicted MFS family arabinose efflux permease